MSAHTDRDGFSCGEKAREWVVVVHVCVRQHTHHYSLSFVRARSLHAAVLLICWARGYYARMGAYIMLDGHAEGRRASDGEQRAVL